MATTPKKLTWLEEVKADARHHYLQHKAQQDAERAYQDTKVSVAPSVAPTTSTETDKKGK